MSRHTKSRYEHPSVNIIRIVPERGFAASASETGTESKIKDMNLIVLEEV